MVDPAKVRQIAQQTLSLPPEERPAFLDSACSGDETLKLAVDEKVAQLADHQKADIDLTVGDHLGPYHLLDLLGEGGMGTVFLAEQKEPVKRRVAVKVVKLGMDTKEVLGRFEAERQALALMAHPNVAAVLDAGATGSGRPYFVMEYVGGIPITEYCDDHNLSLKQRLKLFVQACDAIQHAHQKGIIHRDIKPSNILVTEHDQLPLAKVIDFGVAKSTQQKLASETFHTRLGSFIGTPNYTSPEQAKAGAMDVDTRTDVYSLGVMLYELLTGHQPHNPDTFSGKPIDEIQRIIREVDPPEPLDRFNALASGKEYIARRRSIDVSRLRRELKGDIAWIATRAMEKDRNERYPSASALAADVRRYLNNEAIVARPHSRFYRAGKFISRHRVGFIATSVAMLGLTVGLAFALTGFYRANQAAEEASKQAIRAAQTNDLLLGLFEDARDQGWTQYLPIEDLLNIAVGRVQADDESDPRLRAELLLTVAKVFHSLELRPQAKQHLLNALDVIGETADPDVEVESQARLLLAGVLLELGDVELSRDYAQQSVNLARGSRDPALINEALLLLAGTQIYGERFGAAQLTLSEVAPQDAETAVLLSIRQAELDEGRNEMSASAESLEEALARIDEMAEPDPDLLSRTRTRLAWTLAWMGREEAALTRVAASVQLAEESASTKSLAPQLLEQARLQHHLGNLEAAEYSARRALEESRKAFSEESPIHAEYELTLGTILLERSHARSCGEDDAMDDCLQKLQVVVREVRVLPESKAFLEQAVGHFRAGFGNRHTRLAVALAHLAEVQLSNDDYFDAMDTLDNAESILYSLDHSPEWLKAYVGLLQGAATVMDGDEEFGFELMSQNGTMLAQADRVHGYYLRAQDSWTRVVNQ